MSQRLPDRSVRIGTQCPVRNVDDLPSVFGQLPVSPAVPLDALRGEVSPAVAFNRDTEGRQNEVNREPTDLVLEQVRDGKRLQNSLSQRLDVGPVARSPFIADVARLEALCHSPERSASVRAETRSLHGSIKLDGAIFATVSARNHRSMRCVFTVFGAESGARPTRLIDLKGSCAMNADHFSLRLGGSKASHGAEMPTGGMSNLHSKDGAALRASLLNSASETSTRAESDAILLGSECLTARFASHGSNGGFSVLRPLDSSHDPNYITNSGQVDYESLRPAIDAEAPKLTQRLRAAAGKIR